ncbi:hypothetical protein FCIRC_4024 [Fusarium circinatum]|uniref:Uncharacterized protein n=1 Tax=Fusarium circinatum TaxID=48490 RepID=A0A8H5X6K9_FUSCI|nr:hypothetical protein FCIRC_4024 [Fusarium circinatum]
MALHNTEIRDRLQALEYEVHTLNLGCAPLARKFGLNDNLEYDAMSFLSVSESLQEGEVLEYPYIDYWPAARKQGEIQRRTKALEKGIRVMKWNLGLPDTMPSPAPQVLVDAVKPTPPEDVYRLASAFEALLDDLHDAGKIERNKALYYTRNVAYTLYLRRECKPQYTYNFNEFKADMFYNWRWVRSLKPRDALAGDIEVLCVRNQMICDMIDNREDPIFEDRAALWPSIVFKRLKPDFCEIERAGFRILAWRLCKVDGVVPLWLDRHGFWISGVSVHNGR